MRVSVITILGLLAAACVGSRRDTAAATWWLTTADQSHLLEKQPACEWTEQPKGDAVIEVNPDSLFQTVQGFGFALTGGSATLINNLPADQRDRLLHELFSDEGIAISYLRVSIGASDLDDSPFSYDDLPAGQDDPELKSFSLSRDTVNLIPLLQRIVEINPQIKIMGSPWSAPAWMKTNESTVGGSLREEYYDSYALYFVKYIESMREHGITIDAVTLQNEPEHPGNNPSMLMTATEQATFVRDYLGPAFKRHGTNTHIVVYDHNCDHPEYPIAILNDTTARKYIDGSAFHLYLGEIEALSIVHQAHPDKRIYFTEQWTSSEGDFGDDLLWHVKNLIIGANRNWSTTVIEWNLASDPSFEPHTDGGCTMCKGALTIGESIERNVSYYVIAHASKFVPAGSIRMHSTQLQQVFSVGFVTTTGEQVVVLLNEGETVSQVAVRSDDRYLNLAMPGRAVATLKW
ncbi:MAG: glycoside hydrolase family 30 beta sandwich domain-containing protein [Cyclobacteriaceae bacterium]